MNTVVCLKEVVDSSLSLSASLSHGEMLRRGLPLRLNPSDAAALEMAIDLKRDTGGRIDLVSLGPERVESYLRDGLALGADTALRILDDGLDALTPHRKALLLAAAVSRSSADLVLTGAGSLDTGNAQAGPLIASRLGIPCIVDAVSLEPDTDRKTLTVLRDIGRGAREKVHCALPAVIAVKGQASLPYASLESLFESRSREIIRLSPTDLGIPPTELNQAPTRVTRLVFPQPRPRKVPTPDSSLPAFDRIMKLLEGGITRRKAAMLRGSIEEMVDHLFDLLVEEGVLEKAAGQGAAGK